MQLSDLKTAYDRNQLCSLISPLLNYDEHCNSALIIIKVWHTRQISAHYGYDISQEILSLIADDLQQFVKEDCCLLRTANHEFALLIQNLKNPGHCQLALNRISRDLNLKSIDLKGFSTKTKLTMGAALYPKHALSAEQLVQYVEIALNHSEHINTPTTLYSKQLSERIIKQIHIEAELEEAIASNSLELWYQPKINIQTGGIYGVEALCRWHSQNDGFISPEIFIPLAEQRNFIHELTHWVINTAFRTQVEWKKIGLNINMAVNISGKVIDDENFVSLIEHTQGIWGINPADITLEITESEMMQSMEVGLKKLEQLKTHGFKLSIDDFGTGYSSLEYFKSLPVHEIKIDKCFVFNMLKDKGDLNLVTMMANLANSFSLDIVAEGIEDKLTLEALKKLGVQRAQGYYISKPLPENDFLTWAEFYLTNLKV